MWVISIANFLVYMLRYASLHWGPTYLQEMKHLSKLTSSSLQSGSEFAGMASALIAGYTADRFFRGRAGRVCVIAMALMTLVLYLFWTTPTAMKSLAGVLFRRDGVPGLRAADADRGDGDEHRQQRAAAAAVGLTGIVGYLSSVLSGWGLGSLVDHYGWDAAFKVMIGCTVATAGLMALTWNVGRSARTAGPIGAPAAASELPAATP